MKKWKTLESRTLFKNQWFDIKEEKVQVTDELAVEGVIVHHFSDWVNVIPMTTEGHVLMVSQYRHAAGVTTIETPSGSMDETDATPEDAATRALFEETGYATGTVIFLGKSLANPQIQNNFIHHYLALDCHLVSHTQPEIGGIEDFWVENWSHIIAKVRSGEITQATTVEGLLRTADWLARNPLVPS